LLCCCGITDGFKEGIFLPLEDNDLTISEAGNSKQAILCKKRTPTASAVAEVKESELENANLGREIF